MNVNRLIYGVELRLKKDNRWVLCDNSPFFGRAHSIRKSLAAKWPDYVFRVCRYVPKEKP